MNFKNGKHIDLKKVKDLEQNSLFCSVANCFITTLYRQLSPVFFYNRRLSQIIPAENKKYQWSGFIYDGSGQGMARINCS